MEETKSDKFKWLKCIGKIILLLVTFYITFCGAWNLLTKGDYVTISDINTYFKKIKPSDFSAQVSQSFEEAESCTFNDSEWMVALGQLQKQEDGLYLLASTTHSSLLQYERSVSSGAKITFSFVPLSDLSPNVVIVVHDLFEVVIGDEGKRRVTVKANLVEGKSMSLISADNEDNKSFLLPEELIIGKEVYVKITQQPLLTNQQELILSITYDSSKDPVVKSYHFPIPPEFKASDKPIRVSVGMINTDNEEDILIRFKCFKVSLGDLNSDLG